MKRYSYKFVYKFLLASCLIATFSCKKLVDVEPEDQVDVKNHYQTVYDANAAVIGIYGQFQGIADRYLVLNELRADLMSPTINADQYLRQLSTHTETADNPWADPKPFYKIIMNCNDALKNFDIMLASAKLNRADYNERYADVNAMRCFLYLQLGIHWGSVPYVTDPLENVEALKDQSKFPKLTFEALIKRLITSMESRSLEIYSTTNTIGSTNTSLNTTVDGYPTNFMFINKSCLLGDLYLWDKRYKDAATQYRYVTETGTRNTGGAISETLFAQYKTSYTRFLITYSRANDETTLLDNNTDTNGWRAIFGSTVQGTDTSAEWIWTIPFDRSFAPVNPFINLFSNQGGSYLLTASKLAMDQWAAPIQRNGIVGDYRAKLTVRTINGQPVIAKHLYYYLGSNLIPVNVLQKPGRWLLYRGGGLMLRFAEAACRDNEVKIAYALTNVGIKEVFNGVWPATTAIPSDRTNIQQSFRPAPYDFDAREGDVPYYRAPWHRQFGTRSKANLPQLDPNLINNADLMEDAIIAEAAAELAYEGQRYGDLLRIAIRRNDMNFLAQRVYNKLVADGDVTGANAARAKLMTTNGAYLPFNL